MKTRTVMLAALLLLACPARADDVKRFAVNEYFGVEYEREPVSFDVTFEEPVPVGRIGLRPGPCAGSRWDLRTFSIPPICRRNTARPFMPATGRPPTRRRWCSRAKRAALCLAKR